MTVTTEPLIALDVIDREVYASDEPNVPLYEMSTHHSIPLPEEGEHLTIGWKYDEDGNRLDSWHYMGDESDYVRSAVYKVVKRFFHYHNASETDEEGNYVTRRTETTVTLIVEREKRISNNRGPEMYEDDAEEEETDV